MNRYLEDLSPGDRFHTAAVTVTEADIIEFASRYDAQPMHTDPIASARGPFGGLIASGWHTAALVMGMTAQARPFGDVPVLGLGVEELKWPQPVRPGDTLRVTLEVESVRPSTSNPRYGIVGLRSSTFNQRGELVFLVRPNCWVPRRPASQTP
jgi:acyl dehydratase